MGLNLVLDHRLLDLVMSRLSRSEQIRMTSVCHLCLDMHTAGVLSGTFRHSFERRLHVPSDEAIDGNELMRVFTRLVRRFGISTQQKPGVSRAESRSGRWSIGICVEHGSTERVRGLMRALETLDVDVAVVVDMAGAADGWEVLDLASLASPKSLTLTGCSQLSTLENLAHLCAACELRLDPCGNSFDLPELALMSESLRANGVVMLAIAAWFQHALGTCDEVLSHAAQALFNNEHFVFAAIQLGLEAALAHASPELRDSDSLVLAAVQQHGTALRYASARLSNNELVVRTAVNRSTVALRSASQRLRNDTDFVKSLVSEHPLALRFASSRLQDNEVVALAAVERSGSVLQFVSTRLRDDEAIVTAAVTEDGMALFWASDSLRGCERVVAAALRNNGTALEYASSAMQDSEHIVRLAVCQNGMALQHASARLWCNRSIVRTAVSQNGMALRYAASELRSSEEIVLEAIAQNPLALRLASESLFAVHSMRSLSVSSCSGPSTEMGAKQRALSEEDLSEADLGSLPLLPCGMGCVSTSSASGFAPATPPDAPPPPPKSRKPDRSPELHACSIRTADDDALSKLLAAPLPPPKSAKPHRSKAPACLELH